MQVPRFEGGSYDVVVIGAGHAGTEAGLAASRMGQRTLLLTINLDSLVAMSCNPNIGGTGKGHLVREIDALGGEMALNIDKTFIQSRMLNLSKGPAVHSLRVQADKRRYHEEMKKTVEDQEGLDLEEGEVAEILVENDQVQGVVTTTGAIYRAPVVIVCTGTFLGGRVYMGELNFKSGPIGMKGAYALTDSLKALGLPMMRLKTGTPARVHRDSIDLSQMEIQEGDEDFEPFSFLNIDKDLSRDQVPCYLTYTTPKCHEIIRENINRAAMYLGDIEGTGPRYCPSIEDKVVRFADKDAHQVFIEPEGLTTKEMYIQGVSSSLPEEVQKALYKNIKGLEKAKFMRNAYAIEYDAIDATVLKRSLEHQKIQGLFFAGQINGSSGYEEAAGQGLIAGINGSLKNQGKDPLILDRSQAYIGVLIDDLVTKGTKEPYRMMTSRAEYRLTLRQDNADLRLTPIGYALGLASKDRYEKTLERKDQVDKELDRLGKVQINPNRENNEILEDLGTSPLKNGASLEDLIRRPELSYEKLGVLDPQRQPLRRDIKRQVEIQIKYKGYIEKQAQQIRQVKKLENRKLSYDFPYDQVHGLRNEAREKLLKVHPESLGQASRITGVSPADINVLLIFMEQNKRDHHA